MNFGKHKPYFVQPDHNQRHRFGFENGYGASVIRGQYTYGGSSGLWELAVLHGEGDICYSSPITDDVVGWLSELEVESLLDQIQALPAHPRDIKCEDYHLAAFKEEKDEQAAVSQDDH